MNLGILQKIGDMQSIMQNPQQALQGMMGNKMLMQNPIMKNGIDMYQKGDINGLEKIVENICKERGTSIEDVRKQLGI